MQIGRYEVLEEVGRGGMGAVFRARDPELGREVAIKLLTAPGERVAARFRRECEALARLRHPNLVPVHESGVHQGTPYLVMDFVAGESLEQRLEAGPLGSREAARLLVPLARALDHAHAQGLIHRDVKPANVLLGQGEPRLTDFGLVLALDPEPGEERLSQSGIFLGTPGFAAPEQVAVERSRLGPATDVYGWGATLYAALTGRAPFTGESLLQIAQQTAGDAPAPPSRLAPGVESELEQICLHCLEKEPEDRPPSAGALVALLEAFLATDPSLEREGMGRPGAGPAAAATLVVLGLLGAVGIVWRGTRGGADVESSLEEGGDSGGVASPSSSPSSSPSPSPSSSSGAVVSDSPALGAVASPAPPSPEPELSRAERYNQLCDQAERLADQDRLEEAWVALTAALELDEGQARAWRSRAAVGFFQGDPEGALKDLHAAIEAEPQDAQSWSNRAAVRESIGDLQGAIDDLTRTLELSPDALKPLQGRGGLFVRVGQPAAACLDLDRAIELEPHHPPSRRSRGEARLRLGDHAGCLEDADAILAESPLDPSGFELRGLALSHLGRTAEVEQELTRAVQLGVENARVYSYRGAARFELGRFEEALADYERALALEPSGRRHLYNRAHALQALGRLDESLAAFSLAIESAPDNPAVWHGRAMTRALGGDVEGALKDYTQAIAIDPNYSPALTNRGVLLREHQGDPRRAGIDFDLAIESDPSLMEAWLNRGLLRMDLLNFRGARSDFDQVLALDPRSARGWIYRGWAKSQLREAGASVDIRRGLELLPEWDTAQQDLFEGWLAEAERRGE